MLHPKATSDAAVEKPLRLYTRGADSRNMVQTRSERPKQSGNLVMTVLKAKIIDDYW